MSPVRLGTVASDRHSGPIRLTSWSQSRAAGGPTRTPTCSTGISFPTWVTWPSDGWKRNEKSPSVGGGGVAPRQVRGRRGARQAVWKWIDVCCIRFIMDFQLVQALIQPVGGLAAQPVWSWAGRLRGCRARERANGRRSALAQARAPQDDSDSAAESCLARPSSASIDRNTSQLAKHAQQLTRSADPVHPQLAPSTALARSPLALRQGRLGNERHPRPTPNQGTRLRVTHLGWTN